MIENRVYGLLMRLGKKRLTLFPMGLVVEMCPLIKKLFVCMFFFILDQVIYCSAWLRLIVQLGLGLS